jgi:hypothetical protein
VTRRQYDVFRNYHGKLLRGVNRDRLARFRIALPEVETFLEVTAAKNVIEPHDQLSLRVGPFELDPLKPLLPVPHVLLAILECLSDDLQAGLLV